VPLPLTKSRELEWLKPSLPLTLKELWCTENQITSLDNLPSNLQKLSCSINKLTSLDNLPPTLEILDCINNPFTYDFEPTLENIRKHNTSRMLSS